MAKKRKIRTEFRKNRTSRSRATDLTRKFASDGNDQDDLAHGERISGKGELSRKRTIVTTDPEDNADGTVQLEVDESASLRGRVLSVHGLLSTVEADNGSVYKCATRRLLKTLSTDQRHVVAAGDRVRFRPSGADEGIIERIEPRTSTLSRESRGRQHVIVANADQLLIIASAAEPYIKPNLIDRFLVAAERSHIAPLICINKIDLVDPATLQPMVGVYSQMGYRVLLLSAVTGFGIDRLRRAMAGRQSVVAGQSGVGKSSLLNAIEPGLHLRVAHVSQESQKGRHTTTTAQLLKLSSGGYVVDTPGVRQFQLWDLLPAEVAALYRDIRPFVSHCRYPDCTHAHEDSCAVKDAVADDLIDSRRYESYLHLCAGVLE